jgi:hypothetical protein
LGFLGGESQGQGIPSEEITEERVRIEQPGLPLFNRQEVSVGGSKISLKSPRVDVLRKPLLAQTSSHGAKLWFQERGQIHLRVF